MKAWLTQHKIALAQQLRHMRQHMTHTLLMSLAIGVTLALPLLAYIVIDNLSHLAGSTGTQTQLSVFLKPEATEQTRTALELAIKQQAGVKSSQFVPKALALEQLEESAANPALLGALQQNPLPDAFFITPNSLESADLNALKKSLESLDGVAEVVLDATWLNRLNGLIQTGQQAMLLLAGMMAILLIAVIGNTIRMQVLAHQDEIELSQLIGATPRFIRRPFLYMGALNGLFGGLVAILLAWLILWLFNRAVAQIAQNYQIDLLLNLPSLAHLGLFLLIATAIGWLAALLAFSFKRHPF